MPRLDLGRVTVPSGVLVIGDMGYLCDWSGDGPPGPPRDLPDDLLEQAAGARDCRIVGPDAAAAAARFDRQSLTYLYDIPDVPGLRSLFEECLAGTGLSAVIEEERRIPHRERAQRAAEAGGADFTINGVWFTAVPVTARAPLPVVGERSRSDPHAWRAVEVLVSDARPASTRRIGQLGVDWARLILADADALSHWVHEDSLDGLADVAFWGRDAGEAAQRFDPGRLEEGGQAVYGWTDLPLDRAVALATEVDDWKRRHARRLAIDFRPHSHHHHVMAQVRSSKTESGTLRVGGTDVLGLMTTWGDGVFDVELDDAADGQPATVRIVFVDE